MPSPLTMPGPGGQAPSPAAPSPTPPPYGQTSTPTSLAVLVDLFAGANGYDIALVTAAGRVAARAHAQLRSPTADAAELPYAMASDSRVYYLDGDSQIGWLRADGSTGTGPVLPAGPHVRATFAVTPDDSRIAVALLDYSVDPVQLTLYVEDLGGAHHAVIFTSTSRYVWPVAWHAGRLVVAYIGPSGLPFKSKMVNYSSRDLAFYPYGPSPYGGINFHVINPLTAEREAIISGGGASGLLTRAGSAVVQGQAVDWSGHSLLLISPDSYGSISASGSVSPDGNQIAACCFQQSRTGHMVIWYQGGATKELQANGTSTDWAGWFDNTHLIMGFYQRSDGTPTVVEVYAGVTHPVDAHGIVAGMLPGSLDS